tara:strand:+ start:1032 stop:3485 length:2454 start_codon:yes stop_codon:yes gene_type:complete
MKVPISWLKTLVDIDAPLDDLVEKLSISGFEVESIFDQTKLANGVISGFVLNKTKHPDSERLSVCEVDIGNKSTLNIVCGANNIRSHIHVLVAPIGTYLPSINLNIKQTEIRGVRSQGMICSLQELGVEKLSTGIAVLEEMGISGLKPGLECAELLGLKDQVLELAITANRPDGMSMGGIAREVSAIYNSKLHINNNYELNFNEFTPNIATDNITNLLYSITYIDNLDGSLKSPRWLKNRLAKCEINSINLVVDITNYIMLELGQPLHTFDNSKLSKLINRDVNQNDFGIRSARENELFEGLDNNNYKLNSNIDVITCKDIPIAIAGVIGSSNSSVCDDTKSVWLETAVFNQQSVRKSSREIGLRTESSSRFEKGVISLNSKLSIARALDLYKKQFTHMTYKVFLYQNSLEKVKSIHLRRKRIHKVLGPISTNNNNLDNPEIINNKYLSDQVIEKKLLLIGSKLQNSNDGWMVTVDNSRSLDLKREIDLIEEIARLVGYDKFDSNLPNPINVGQLSHKQKAKRAIRNNLISQGFSEITTSSLVEGSSIIKRVKITNPLFTDTSYLRDNLWEEHINICNRNINFGSPYCWIFEIGKEYYYENNNIKEISVLGGAIYGNKSISSWAKVSKNNELNYFEARGKISNILQKVKIEDRKSIDKEFLHPGMSSDLYIENKYSGFFGEIHPKLISENKSLKKIFLFNIYLENLIEAATRKRNLIPLFKHYPSVPSMERDFTFLFDKQYTCEEILKQIRKLGKPYLVDAKLIDIYKDDLKLGDKVSLTFRLKFRDDKKTLLEEDIKSINEKITSQISKTFKAERK